MNITALTSSPSSVGGIPPASVSAGTKKTDIGALYRAFKDQSGRYYSEKYYAHAWAVAVYKHNKTGWDANYIYSTMISDGVWYNFYDTFFQSFCPDNEKLSYEQLGFNGNPHTLKRIRKLKQDLHALLLHLSKLSVVDKATLISRAPELRDVLAEEVLYIDRNQHPWIDLLKRI